MNNNKPDPQESWFKRIENSYTRMVVKASWVPQSSPDEYPLTWRQLVAILAGLAAFAFGIMAIGQGSDLDPVRHFGKTWLPHAVVICIFFTIWHLRIVRQPDVYPDILGRVFPIGSILELGRCHLVFTARGCGGGVEIVGYIQNLKDGPGKLAMGFEPPYSVFLKSITIPDLVCDVPPAAVVEVRGRFPAQRVDAKKHILYLEGKFRGRGRQVRFTRRRALTLRTNPLISLFLLVKGHFHAGGGSAIAFTMLEPGDPDSISENDGQWETFLYWSPEGGDTQGHTRASSMLG